MCGERTHAALLCQVDRAMAFLLGLVDKRGKLDEEFFVVKMSLCH